MRRPWRALASAVIVTAVAVVASRAGAGAPSPDAPPPGPSGSAGAASCRECHPRAYRAWESSAHALTVREATEKSLPPEVLSSAPVKHPPGESSFLHEGSRFSARTVGMDGAPTTVPIEWVIGLRRIRMLIGRVPDGRLQVLPSMREEPSGKWFDYTHLLFGGPEMDPTIPPKVAPGDDAFWTGPVRSFDAKCVRCHASGAERKEPSPEGVGSRTAWRAPSVDCEACHGPGGEHAAFWAALPKDRSKDPILRTGGLDRDHAVALCLKCHLEATVVTPTAGFSGDPFEDVVPTLLDDVVRVDASGRPLELIYDGLPFSTSTCAERGQLTCHACHDSHGTANPSQLVAPADGFAQCSSCHAEDAADPAAHSHHKAGGEGAKCVACHMPLVEIERGHGAVRDHTIGIPHPREGGPRAAADACTWCHDGGRGAPHGVPALAPEKVRSAYESWWPGRGSKPYWVEPIARARSGDVSVLSSLDEILGSTSVPRVIRASAARLLGKFPAQAAGRALALSTDDDALVRSSAFAALAAVRSPEADAAFLAGLRDASPVVRREAARAALSGWERAQANRPLLLALIPVLEADALAVPDDDGRWFMLGAARQLAGDLVGAISAYERQLSLDPHASNVRQHVEALRKAAPKTPPGGGAK